jgi:hypothetical protein
MRVKVNEALAVKIKESYDQSMGIWVALHFFGSDIAPRVNTDLSKGNKVSH